MKICLLVLIAILSGCVAYPEPMYYPVAPAGPDPQQAQAAANAQCAKSGKVAVKVKPTNCTGSNCTTTFECQ